MMNKLLFFIFLAIAQNGFSQCPFPVTLDATGKCTGDTLFITTTNKSLSQIVWYNGASIVQTITSNSNSAGVTVAGGNGFGSAANQFMSPQSVFLDANGNIYVSDELNERVQKFPPGSTSSTNGVTVAGGNGNGSAANQFAVPLGICVDGNGNIYVADVFNERIQKWAPGATAGVTVAGGNGVGSATNQFNNPYDVFVDGSGNIYVADWLNERVQKFPAGSTGATNGVTVAGGNGGGNAANQLNGPTNVFVDGSGNVYVTDRTNERIQKWAPGATSGVTVAGGNGIGSAANQLDAPFGIYVDANGNLYVADDANSRIQKFPAGSTGATDGVTIAGGNGFGNAANQFDGPASVYVAGNGDIYVDDLNNERIQKWAQRYIDTTYITTAPGIYTTVVSDSSGCTVTTNPVVINPSVTPGINIVESGNPLCSGTGTFTASITNGGSAPYFQWQVNGVPVGTDNGSYNSTNLVNADLVRCILTSNAVCNTSPSDTSNAILVSTAPAVTLKSLTGNCLGDSLVISTTDSLSQIIWYNGSNGVDTSKAVSIDSGVTVAGGNGGGAAANQLDFPQGIFVDASGNLYVVDENNNRVQKWAPGATNGVTVAGGNGFGPAANQLNGAAGIWVDAGGNIYIADYGNFRVQKWAPGATSGVTVAGGNGSGSAANQFDFPVGICLDNAGNIYVADNNNHRVQKWAPGASSGITVAGGNGAGSGANQLDFPEDVFVHGSGNIYVLDEYNFRVQKWAPGATSGVTVAGGNGQGSGANQLNFPYGLYVDANGNIYIGDSDNDRVQKWAPGATSGVTVAGGNGGGSGLNQLLDPRFVFVDGNGNVYVSEDENGRVQKWAQSTVDTIYKPITPGTYTAVVTNSAGCSTTSNPIVINPIVSPKVSIISSDTSICTGTSITFTATAVNGGTIPIYQWQVNGNNLVGGNNPTYTSDSILNGSTIRCILTSNALCALTPSDTSNNIFITVANPVTPAITITASQINICSGISVTFGVSTLNPGTNPSYQWQVNGSNTGTSNPGFTSNTLNNGDVVSCLMTSNVACATANPATSNSIIMNVAPQEIPSATISPSANNICSGIPVVFTVIPTNSGDAPSFQWMVNGINSGGNSATFTSNALNNGDTVYCIMTSSLACTSPDSSSAVHMVVYPLPLVSFNPDTVYTPVNGGVQLMPVVTGTINQYQWSPASELNNADVADPVATPSNEITCNLLVTTDHGCIATGKVTVIAGRPLEIPNAFTPNNDGHNDIFRIPPGVQFNLQELDIFDSWGIRVFATRDITQGWDGTYQGSPAETGTYVYLITGKTPAGKPVFLKGTVVLIRY